VNRLPLSLDVFTAYNKKWIFGLRDENSKQHIISKKYWSSEIKEVTADCV